MKRRKSADASERIRQLQERVKAGNLPYFDPLADGRALEYDRALAHHYGGFKARAHPSARLARCSLRRVLCVELLRLLHGGDGVRFARVLRACAGVCVRPELISGVTSDEQRRSIMCMIRDFCVSRPCG
jgi:hypothetical protein